MQLQGILILFVFIIMIPILILSANHNVFFVLMAIVLLLSSIKNIYNFLTKHKPVLDKEEQEMLEDFEISSDLNMKRFSAGIRVVFGLIIVLFFTYCAFYLNVFWIKIIIALAIVYRIYDIKFSIKAENLEKDLEDYNFINKIFYLSSNVSTVFIILAAAFYKFLKSPF